MKERIMKYLNAKKIDPINKNQLYKEFTDVSRETFEGELNKLIDNFDVVVNKKGRIISATKAGYIRGIVSGIIPNMAFIKVEDDERDIKIDVYDANKLKLRYKDEVLLKQTGYGYKLESVIKHHINKIVGEYKIDVINGQKDGYFVPENRSYNVEFDVDYEDSKNLVDGHKVIFTLSDTKFGTQVKLEKIIGHKNDPGVDIETKLAEAEAPISFSKKTMNEVEALPTSINKKDYPKRLDLTDKIIFTIDGADAKDLDDAVECYYLDNGNFMLGVHIADVSNYVVEGSAMDLDALDRGTSIYLADRVVPMYPHKLSNGICSLNPYVDRLAMTCYMEINKEGRVVSSKIKDSIINSKKRFTYKEVNDILERNDKDLIEANKEFVPALRNLHKVALALRNNRDERGQLELDLPESKIIVDEFGKAVDVVLRERGEGEKLIEDCMVAANETVAEAIRDMKLPYLYRIHDNPDSDKIKLFSNIARSMDINVQFGRNVKVSEYIKKVFAAADDEVKRDILGFMFLRSLPKAIYSPKNIGHYGLGSDCYTHFTSPIRRYPDTIVHRMLKKYLFEKEHLNQNFDKEYYEALMESIGESTSSQERRAIQLERDVNDMKKAEYMENKIGEQFTGKVSGFISKGLFVQLPNTVEGFINYNDLGEDVFKFNKDKFQAEAITSKKVIKVGMPIKIIVSRADKGTSKIDFKPTNKLKKDKKNKTNR